MSPQKVAAQFVTAINAHDVERLASLVTSDHRFIDSLGSVVEGRDAVREGWKFYFSMVPDYKLEIRRYFIAEHGKAETMLVGVASGSYCSNGIKLPNSLWSTPAAYGLLSIMIRLPSGRCMQITNPFASKCALRRPNQTPRAQRNDTSDATCTAIA